MVWGHPVFRAWVSGMTQTGIYRWHQLIYGQGFTDRKLKWGWAEWRDRVSPYNCTHFHPGLNPSSFTWKSPLDNFDFPNQFYPRPYTGEQTLQLDTSFKGYRHALEFSVDKANEHNYDCCQLEEYAETQRLSMYQRLNILKLMSLFSSCPSTACFDLHREYF